MLLYIALLSTLLHSAPDKACGKDPISVQFTFEEMKPGKPPLKIYRYKLVLKNLTPDAYYMGIPRWINNTVMLSDKVWGAEYDKFGDMRIPTLFATSSFSIVHLKGNQEITLPGFELEYMGDEFSSKEVTLLHVLVFKSIHIDKYALEEFMEKDELHLKNLVYTIDSPFDQMAHLPLKN